MKEENRERIELSIKMIDDMIKNEASETLIAQFNEAKTRFIHCLELEARINNFLTRDLKRNLGEFYVKLKLIKENAEKLKKDINEFLPWEAKIAKRFNAYDDTTEMGDAFFELLIEKHPLMNELYNALENDFCIAGALNSIEEASNYVNEVYDIMDQIEVEYELSD